MDLKSNKKRNAFTLIELLVVISIIAILMSIMMPALSVARDQAKKTLCGSNSRSIGMACAQFGIDNDDWLPMYDGGRFSGSSYEGKYPHKGYWYVDIASYLDYDSSYADYLDRSVAGDAKQASERGYEAPKILSCPSLSAKDTNGVKSLAFGWNWRSAGYRYDSSYQGNWWKPRRSSMIKNASTSAILGENRWDVPYIYAWGGLSTVPGKYYYSDRHRGGSHYLCADGHLEFAEYDFLVEDFLSGGSITEIKPSIR
ncbi:MAG: type II secretion system protein [Sedimentisphaeraceae bacterium JB056]